MTIQILRDFGADVEDGLGRCMNNEAFYLRLVGMALSDEGFEKLRDAADAGDTDAAFSAAHALKGVLGNLSLTPLYRKASEITELLRAKEEADYPALSRELIEMRDRLAAAEA